MLDGIGPARQPSGQGVLNQGLDVHGEQDGPVDEQIALWTADLAASGLIAEFGTGMLQGGIYGVHGFHLQDQAYRVFRLVTEEPLVPSLAGL
jgi:hypothetical protein